MSLFIARNIDSAHEERASQRNARPYDDVTYVYDDVTYVYDDMCTNTYLLM